MTRSDIEKILELNREGIIPGPKETEENFLKRAEYCLTLQQHLSDELKASLSAIQIDDPSILNPSCSTLKRIYDISPKWIPLFFSNYKLPFWHGGSAWIFQVSENTPTGALVQIRQRLQKSSTYLGIYSRDELLTHELAHVARMEFHEPKFEEVLAYRTSLSSFRRWFGPIIQSSTESVIFILLLFMITVFDVFLVAMDRQAAYHIALWLKVIPLVMIAYGLFRVFKKQKTIDACIKNIAKCMADPSNASAVAFRLTDSEIQAFSKMSEIEIRDYIDQGRSQDLRLQVISLAYFPSRSS